MRNLEIKRDRNGVRMLFYKVNIKGCRLCCFVLNNLVVVVVFVFFVCVVE